jgi:hypothetical protein
MKLLVAFSAVILTGMTATAANAASPQPQTAAGTSAHSTLLTNVRYRYGRYFDFYGPRAFYVPRNCCVMGPAYGHAGNWLGPAYNTDLWMPNPATCGPGACQDNPWY